MARVEGEDLARICREVAIERLAEARSVKLEKSGDVLVGVCPFHEATDATLTINPANNRWSCTTCSPSSASVIEWVMKAEGVSKTHATELLNSDFSPSTSTPKRGRQKGVVPVHATTTKLEAPFTANEPDDVLLRRVIGFYHEALKQSPESLGYLQKRGITNGEAIPLFQIGFANRTLAYRLPSKSRKAGADLRARLQRLGVLRDSGHENLNGSLVVPLFDANGKVVNAYGRKITPGLRPGTPLHTWLDDSKRGLLNLPVLGSSKAMIVTASILDALALWSQGHRNVTAVHGLDGPVDDLMDAITTHKTERVLVAFRRSTAGDRAVDSVGKRIADIGVEVRRIAFPAGMDAIDFVLAAPNPSERLGSLIRSAEWVAGKAATKPLPEPVTVPPVAPVTDAIMARGAEHVAVPQPPEKTATDEVVLTFDDRRWRIRGLARTTPETMKVNVMVTRDGAALHVDVVELYSARQRTTFTKMASDELGMDEGLLKRDLGHVLLRLEEEQDELARRAAAAETKQVEMTDEDRDAARGLLRDPRLLDRILDDFASVGVVGEKTNLLVGYLASISRKLERPLAVVIQSSAAAGKSSLLEAVLDFVPEEDRLSFSAMTGQSLYYMGASSLRNKVLAVAEEAGAERASYALKLLQSEGALTIASTGKDPTSGRLVSHEYHVEGPVAIMMTTTAMDVDEELLSRCIVLTVDEGPEQTRAIQAEQRAEMTLAGRLRRRERARVLRRQQNAQRLLRPMLVVNPFTHEMTYGDHRVRARRDHRKLLGLVEAVALLHQHRREVKSIEHGGHVVRYIEVEKGDIEIASKLMNEIGGPGVDDLPPQTKRLLGLLVGYVNDRARRTPTKGRRFSRREIREALGLGDTQLWTHLRRLVEAEYLVVHPSGSGRGIVYELAFDGVGTMEDSGRIRPEFGGHSGDVRPSPSAPIPGEISSIRAEDGNEHENAHLGNQSRSE